MASVGSYGNTGGQIQIEGTPTVKTIYNVDVTLINTEFSQILPSSTVEFVLKSRTGNQTIKLAYNSGDSGTLYYTIPKGVEYNDSNFHDSVTVYFQSNITGVVEIVAWSI